MAVMEEDLREGSGALMEEDSSATMGEQEETAGMSDATTTDTEASESDTSGADEGDEELPTQWF